MLLLCYSSLSFVSVYFSEFSIAQLLIELGRKEGKKRLPRPNVGASAFYFLQNVPFPTLFVQECKRAWIKNLSMNEIETYGAEVHVNAKLDKKCFFSF